MGVPHWVAAGSGSAFSMLMVLHVAVCRESRQGMQASDTSTSTGTYGYLHWASRNTHATGGVGGWVHPFRDSEYV